MELRYNALTTPTIPTTVIMMETFSGREKSCTGRIKFLEKSSLSRASNKAAGVGLLQLNAEPSSNGKNIKNHIVEVQVHRLTQVISISSINDASVYISRSRDHRRREMEIQQNLHRDTWYLTWKTVKSELSVLGVDVEINNKKQNNPKP